MLIRLVLVGFLFVQTGLSAENWPGRGGIAGRHASAVDVDPARAHAAWQRSFPVSRAAKWDEPVDFMNLPVGRGAFNLALRDGRLAVVAADVARPPGDYALSILDVADGRTVNSVSIEAGLGNRRVFNWPHHAVGMACDVTPGLLPIWWDPQSAILFTAQTGYDAGYTAYLPLANAATWKPGALQPAVPAFASLLEKSPALADAFGFTRGEHIARLGVSDPDPRLLPKAWGPSLLRLADGDTKGRDDLGYGKANGFDALYFYNNSGQLYGDPAGPLIGVTTGAGTGHNTAGFALLYNKWNGLKVLPRVLETPPQARPGERLPAHLRPFTSGGVLLFENGIYCAGPGDDRDGNGRFGDQRVTPDLQKVDQGLHLWALDARLENRQADGGAAGEAALDTATVQPLFVHRFETLTPRDPERPEASAPSYYEGDNLYRPKAFLVDAGAIWFAWKPAWGAPVELIRADRDGARTWSLDVAAGRPAIELWPKLALAQTGNARRLVYYTGHGARRVPYAPDAATAERLMAERYKNLGNARQTWADLPEEQRRKSIENATRGRWWSETVSPPSGPAEIVCFDPASGKAAWRDDVTKRAGSLPVNDFFTTIDESHLVVAGRWAYVGWVDATGDQAQLRLLAYDLGASQPDPRELSFPLGFSGREFPRSVLTDLIAADGTIYALVHQSRTLHLRDPRWEQQHVVAVRAK